jgi:cytoskeleton protein RodZ
MTDENSNKEEATTESTKATPGQQLRMGREAMGLSQQQVADRLHLRLGNIQDIESDTHKPGVSITFTKGYVRIYAKLLGMTAEPLLEAFDVIHQGEKQPAKLQSFSQRVAKQANDDRWMMVTYLIVILVIASLVVWWFQQAESDESSILERFNWFSSEEAEQSTQEGELVSALGDEEDILDPNSNLINVNLPSELAVPESAITESQSNVEDATDTALNVNTSTSTEPVNDNVAPDSLQDESDVLATVEDELSEQINNAETELNEALDDAFANMPASENENGFMVNADGSVNMVFTFSEDCWLQVTDANEEVIAVGVKVKGRVMPVKGMPPITVNMCPPDYVDINFAGTDVDLSSYRPGSPVQFELSVTGE